MLSLGVALPWQPGQSCLKLFLFVWCRPRVANFEAKWKQPKKIIQVLANVIIFATKCATVHVRAFSPLTCKWALHNNYTEIF